MKKLFAALLAVVFVLGSSVAYGATTHYGSSCNVGGFDK